MVTLGAYPPGPIFRNLFGRLWLSKRTWITVRVNVRVKVRVRVKVGWWGGGAVAARWRRGGDVFRRLAKCWRGVGGVLANWKWSVDGALANWKRGVGGLLVEC